MAAWTPSVGASACVPRRQSATPDLVLLRNGLARAGLVAECGLWRPRLPCRRADPASSVTAWQARQFWSIYQIGAGVGESGGEAQQGHGDGGNSKQFFIVILGGVGRILADSKPARIVCHHETWSKHRPGRKMVKKTNVRGWPLLTTEARAGPRRKRPSERDGHRELQTQAGGRAGHRARSTAPDRPGSSIAARSRSAEVHLEELTLVAGIAGIDEGRHVAPVPMDVLALVTAGGSARRRWHRPARRGSGRY